MPLFDKQEKTIAGISLCLIFLFIAVVVYAQNKYSPATLPQLPTNKLYTTGSIETITPYTYRVVAVANNQTLEPSHIIIPAGSSIDLYITSADTPHWFTISGKKIHLKAAYGMISKASLQFDVPGIYTITSAADTDSGHPIEGTILVSPATTTPLAQP